MSKVDTKIQHLDIAQCWLRQYVQNGHFIVDDLPTIFMVSNGLTKLLPPPKHREFIKQLSLINLEKTMEEQRDMDTG